jgi:hypothetical protein
VKLHLGPLLLCLAATIIALGIGGCDPSFPNPSGTCGIRSDGGRAGYHAPGGDDMWVPDCQNPLLREYWRVFSSNGVSAYVIPRPDGAPELGVPCADPQAELHPLVDRYELCAAAGAADASVINNIQLSDALRITHYLHTQLKFVVSSQYSLGIQPYAIPSDVVDACAVDRGSNSTDLEAICQHVRDQISSGTEGPPFTPTEAGSGELAMRLNQLYGIP